MIGLMVFVFVFGFVVIIVVCCFNWLGRCIVD